MKNRLLIILFIPFLSISQEVSPYFPTPFISRHKHETQMTYFDVNFVSLKLQRFFRSRFKMQLLDTKFDLKDGKGEIINVFEETGAVNRDLKKVNVVYEIFPINKEFVIKSVRIVGNFETVTKFYVFYWSTDLNFGDLKNKEIAKNFFFQDRISYSSNNGNPVINVVNTAFDNEVVFTKEFLEKKQKYEKKQKALAIENNLKDEALKLKRERIANQIIKEYKYDVIKKKKKLTYKQTGSYFIDENAKSNDLKQAINNFMADQKKGIYLIKVIYKYEYDKLVNTNFKVKAYKKPKGFLDYVSY